MEQYAMKLNEITAYQASLRKVNEMETDIIQADE
jgi:hypothetical protein